MTVTNGNIRDGIFDKQESIITTVMMLYNKQAKSRFKFQFATGHKNGWKQLWWKDWL